MRSVGVQPVALCRFADSDRIEPGGLNQDVLCVLGDHAIEAAHYSGKSNWMLGVGDDQVFGRKLVIHAIESLQRLALPGAPDDNLAAFEQVKIECVSGMPHLPQCVVGSISGIVNRALIDECE